MVDWLRILQGAYSEVLRRAAGFIPTLVGVLLILIIGWIVAKVLEQIVVKVLKLVKLDLAGEKSGITAFFTKGGIRVSLSELVGVLVYWLVMLIVFVTAINALGLTVAAELLDKAVAYIPNVVVAVFILILGIFFATLVGSVIRTAAANAGLVMANGLARLAQIVMIIFASVAALEQLQIAKEMLNSVLLVILGSLGLGIAIAIGLGCKDIAARYVNDFLQQLTKKS